MNLDELAELEHALGRTFPDYYRQTLLAYPFPRESFASELLPGEPAAILRINSASRSLPCPLAAVFVGSDGGEEVYFIDPTSKSSRVFKYDFESGKCSPAAESWTEYLGGVTSALTEIERDEADMPARKAARKWWQVWR